MDYGNVARLVVLTIMFAVLEVDWQIWLVWIGTAVGLVLLLGTIRYAVDYWRFKQREKWLKAWILRENLRQTMKEDWLVKSVFARKEDL